MWPKFLRNAWSSDGRQFHLNGSVNIQNFPMRDTVWRCYGEASPQPECCCVMWVQNQRHHRRFRFRQLDIGLILRLLFQIVGNCYLLQHHEVRKRSLSSSPVHNSLLKSEDNVSCLVMIFFCTFSTHISMHIAHTYIVNTLYTMCHRQRFQFPRKNTRGSRTSGYFTEHTVVLLTAL